VTDPHGQAIAYEYDPRGLVTSLTHPDGTRIAYEWDKNGQLVRAEDPTGRLEYRYDQAGKLVERRLPNGVATSYRYDAARRLATIEHRAPGGDLLLSIGYAYDQTGNRTEMTRIVSTDASEVTYYGYDDLDRLTQVSYPDGETVTYEYDSTGNRLRMNSSRSGETRYMYDELGRLTAIQGPHGVETLDYDANGNLIRRTRGGKETTYLWDYENRLIGVQDDSTQVEFRYDGDGRRLEKIVDGRVTRYFQDGNVIPQVLVAASDDGVIRSLPGQPRSGEAGPLGRLYYLEDSLGSIVGATDPNGALVGTTVYDAFGAARGQSSLSTQFGYTNEQADEEIGLIFLRARFYDPEDGRFISPDTFPASTFDTTTLNRYVYVRNNPVNLVDPMGLQFGPPPPPPFAWQSRQTYSWDQTHAIRVSNPAHSSRPPGLRPGDIIIYRNTNPITWAIGLSTPGGNAGHVAIVLPNGTLLTARPGAGATIDALTTLPPKYGSYDIYRPSREIDGRALSNYAQMVTGNRSNDYDYLGLLGVNQPFQQKYTCASVVCGASAAGGNPLGNLGGNRLFDPISPNNIAASPTLEKIYSSDPQNSPPAGGVLLDQVAMFFGTLTDITGASFDPSTGQLVLVGSQDVSLPPMDPDDLVVAIRAVYSGEDPGVTMVPLDPTMQDITQRVEYFGHTENTRFGQMMFEADRYLKGLAGGEDTLTGQPVSPDVPGFKSEVDLMVDLGIGDVPWHRNWFVPGEITLKRSADGQAVIFDKASIKLESRFIRFDADGNPQDLPGSSPVTDRFTRFVTDHYDELAAGKPELAELVRLAKIVGVVKWLHDANIPVDFGWLGTYPIQKVDTPTTTPGLVAQKSAPDGSYTISSMGGVTYDTPNTYIADVEGQAGALGADALAARPAEKPIAWSFEHDGQTLKAVALNLAPTKIVGGYTDTWTDAAIPLAGGMTATIIREYNSLDPRSGIWGPGWRLTLPSLEFRRSSVPDQPGAYIPQAFVNDGLSRSEFQGVTEDGLYMAIDPASPYWAIGVMGSDPENVGGLPNGFAPVPAWFGEPIEIASDQGQLLEFAAFAVFRKDGAIMVFDPLGRLVGLRDVAGNQVSYEYENDRLATIADAKGRGLQLSYDANGKLRELEASDGSIVGYGYDAAGRLVSVSDAVGPLLEYTYDANNRLVTVKDGYGRIVQENSYDQLGRAVSLRSGDSEAELTASFDDLSGTVRYANTDGATLVAQYDDLRRLTQQSDALGNTVSYTYDQNDRITSVTDPKGHTMHIIYGENGNLAEIRSPRGDTTRWLAYNEQGLPLAMIDAGNNVTLMEYDEFGRTTRVSGGYRLEALSTEEGLMYSAVSPISVAYSYDPFGNIVAMQDAAGATTRITYDELGNAIEINFPEGGAITQAYDERSRLKTMTDPTGFQTTFDYSPRGQVTQISSPTGVIGFDYSDGRLSATADLAGRITRYAYDNQGRLAGVIEPTGAETAYEYDSKANLSAVVDAEGRRVEYQYDRVGRLNARIDRGGPSANSLSQIPEPAATITQAPTSEALVLGDALATPTPASETPLSSAAKLGLAIGLALVVTLVLLILLLSLHRRRNRVRDLDQEW
jgi:RHS repeat-associated protein